MNPIDETFRRLQARGEKALLPFLPAGDPDLAVTARLVREVAAAGAHLVEIGFPYSDPIADGPVIQAAYTRALDRGLKIDEIFDAVRTLSSGSLAPPPLLGMAAFSLIYRRDPAAFLDASRKAGLSGLIVPDLPAEEAEGFANLAAERDIRLVLLVTPTTPPARAERIVKRCSGFVYCVSVAGITGERDRLPEELLGQLRRLRTMTDLPLCVGFGVSRPDHARTLREVADGVIVGSAFVRRLERAGQIGFEAAVAEVRELVSSLAAALNPATTR